MSSRFDLLAQQLLQQNLEDCTLETLEAFASANPHVAAAQFLLARKLRDRNDPEFRVKAQRAALYHHQPVAFDAFLASNDFVFAPAEAPVSQQPETLVTPVAAVPEPELQEIQEEQKQYEELSAATEVLEAAPDAEAPALQVPEAPVPAAELPLAFEPFHTVDYFASQGIKLVHEEQPKDNFGKQLKSFTEWLKTMKKLPASEQGRNMDPHAEQKVEHLAAHSVSTSEVLTETMAEVWAKQGQWQKAAEVYRKLSLLHPSKKAYFAAKVENLKQ